MKIEEALNAPGPLVAVWDESRKDDAWLGIYLLGPEAPALLAHELMRAELRSPSTVDIRKRGIRIGSITGASPFGWSADGSFTIWSDSAVEIEATKADLAFKSGRSVPATDVTRVVSFVDDEARGHRGVQLDLKDGSSVVVVEENDSAAELDPTYGWDNVAVDGFWASLLAKHLASWLGVPHMDELR